VKSLSALSVHGYLQLSFKFSVTFYRDLVDLVRSDFWSLDQIETNSDGNEAGNG
jgi:hypothetical protein